MIVENGIGDPSSNPGQGLGVFLLANTLGKGMNPYILPTPVTDKWLGKLDSLSLVWS